MTADRRFLARMRRRMVLVAAAVLVATLGTGVPAHASTVYWHKVTLNFSGQKSAKFSVQFVNTNIGGHHYCLDAANGSLGYFPQTDVWSCGANSDLLNFQLFLTSGTSGTDFVMEALAGGFGCVQWMARPNGSPVAMDNEDICVPGAVGQLWSIWKDNSGHEYLAPNDSDTSQAKIPVVSIANTPSNGQVVAMWTSGANSDQIISLSSPV
jgi:hypothetical protein